MYGPSLSLHDALPILEVIEHIFPGRDVDRDVGPFIGGNFSKAALLERLAGRHDLDHRGVARIDITLNAADDARRLHRREDRKSKRLKLQSLMRISYAVFCLKTKKKKTKYNKHT